MSTIHIDGDHEAPLITRHLNPSLLRKDIVFQLALGTVVIAFVIVALLVGIAVFSVTVKYDYPVCNADTSGTYKRTPVRIFVLENDNDPRGANLTVISVTVPRHGRAEIRGNGEYILYTPNKYFAGTDVFEYQAQNDKLVGTANVTVTVWNHKPEVIPLAYRVLKNSKNSAAAIFQYKNAAGIGIIDVDDDIMHIANVTSAMFGTVAFDRTNIYYTPNVGFNGEDRLNYTISDDNDTATEEIKFDIYNVPPQPKPDSYTISKNSLALLDVLQNDIDPSNDTLSIFWCGNSVNGGCIPSSDSQFAEYIPSWTSKTISDSFEYEVTDGTLIASSYVVVNLVNSPPVVKNVSVTIGRNSIDNIVLFDSLVSDLDIADTTTIRIIQQAMNGNAQLIETITKTSVPYAGDKKFVTLDKKSYKLIYSPNTNFNGMDTIGYEAEDMGELKNSAIITFSVGNLPPVVQDITAYCSNRRTSFVFVYVNVSDPNGDPTYLSDVFTNPSTRGFAIKHNATHAFYIAPQSIVDTDTFYYKVLDVPKDAAEALPAIGVVTVKFYNEAPTATTKDFSVQKGMNATFYLSAGDSDPNGDAIYLNDISNPLLGFVQIINQSHIFYQSNNQIGVERLSYRIRDALGALSEPKLVSINIVNSAPIAVDDSYSTKWNSSIGIHVMDNDWDFNPGDKEILRIYYVSQPTQGGSCLNKGFSILYTPRKGFVGIEQFSYSVKDQYNVSNDATVTMNVTNSAPKAFSDFTFKHHLLQFLVIDVLQNDVDIDGDPISILHTNNSRAIIAQQGIKQVLYYSSFPGFVGLEYIQYTITDWNAQDSNTVIVNVTNSAPVAMGDQLSVHWSDTTAKTIPVIANDFDPDNDPVVLQPYFEKSQPFYGLVSIASSMMQFTGFGAGFVGQQTIYYFISDGVATTKGSVNVSIHNKNVPSPANITRTFHWSSQTAGTAIALLTSAYDADGDSLSFITHHPFPSVVSNIDATSILFKKPLWLGTDIFKYTVSDGLTSAFAYVKVTIYNTVPVARNAGVAVPFTKVRSGIQFDLIEFVSDLDADTLTITFLSTTSDASVSRSGSVVTFLPSQFLANHGGNVSLVYTVSDGIDYASANVTIRVPFIPAFSSSKFFDVHWTSYANGTTFNLNASIISLAVSPVHGTVLVTSNTTVLYKPNPFYIGDDYFEVYFDDNGVTTNTIKVYVNVFNNKPVAPEYSFSYHWRNMTNVTMTVLNGVTDPDNDTISLIAVSNGVFGTAVIFNTAILYTARATFITPQIDTITYSVSDGVSTTTRAITIHSTNVAIPSATQYSVQKHWRSMLNASVSIPILASLIDTDGDALSLAVVSQPQAGGIVALSNDGKSVSYIHERFVGTETALYSVSDGIKFATGALFMNITNTKPVASDDCFSFHWRAVSLGVLLNPIFNDTDSMSDPLMLVAISSSLLGAQITIMNASHVLYRLAAPVIGTDMFTYTISDTMEMAWAKVTVAVTNAVPIPQSATISLSWNTSTLATLNCSDPNKDPISFTLSSNGQHGVASLNSSGYLRYTSNEYIPLNWDPLLKLYVIYDTFNYQCSDSVSFTTSTVTVKIIHNGFALMPDNYAFVRNVSNRNAFKLSVLANDTSLQGTTLKLIFAQTSGSGVVTRSSDNLFLYYTPSPTFSGYETLTYFASDGVVNEQTSVLVNMINNAPICNNVFKSMFKGATLKIYVLQEANCFDANLDALYISYPLFVTQKAVITVGSDSMGNFIMYSPNPLRSGTDIVNFTVSDGFTTITRSIFITIVNRAPIIPSDKNITLVQSFVPQVYALSVLGNIVDPDTDNIVLVNISQSCFTGNKSALVIQEGYYVQFNYPAAWNGSCVFMYTVRDVDADYPLFVTGKFFIYVTKLPPVAVPDFLSVEQGETLTVPVAELLLNDYDLSNSSIYFDSLWCAISGPCNARVNNGFLIITTSPTACGTSKFIYQIRTSDNRTSTAPVYLRITDCECSNPVDVIYIVDGSSVFSNKEWKLLFRMLDHTLDSITVGPNNVWTALVQYSDHATMSYEKHAEYGFNFINSSTHDATLAMKRIDQLYGPSGMVYGLSMALQYASTMGRPNVPKSFVLVSGSAPNAPCSCNQCMQFYNSTLQCAANALTCANCTWQPSQSQYCMPCADPRNIARQIRLNHKLIVVGIGDDVPPATQLLLNEIASPASYYRVYWYDIDAYVPNIVDDSCQQ